MLFVIIIKLIIHSFPDHASVVYTGVPHPSLGSQRDLTQLVEAIHAEGMQVIVDINWTSFSRHSDFYNYDGSEEPTVFGALFQTSEAGVDSTGQVRRAIDLGVDRPGSLLLNDLLYRYTWTFGMDGVYWKGLLCLRVNGTECADGVGMENLPNAQYLRDVVKRLDTVKLWVGKMK